MKIVLRRSSQVLATVLLVLALSSVFFGLEPVLAADGSEALSMSAVEDVSILGSGEALVTLLMSAADSPLADMYRELLAAPSDAGVGEEMPIPENKTEDGAVMPVRQEFHRSIKQEQMASFGFPMQIFNSSMVPMGEQGECRVSINAVVLSQIVSITDVGSDVILEVVVGPKDENATEIAFGFVLTKVGFAQMMLESVEGEQVYELAWTTRIKVPAEAALLNGDELEALSWAVNFGGGTSMSAFVDMDGPSTIVLSERTLVTEQNMTATPEEIFEAFSGYKVFTIRYQLPKSALEEGEGTWTSELGRDWSKRWDWRLSFSVPFPFTYGPISGTLTVTPTFSLSAYIGWDFDWFPWPRVEWFKAWISVGASVNVRLDATITVGAEHTWERTLYDALLVRFTFSIGPVPVWADLRFSVIARLTVGANAEVTLWTVAEVGAEFKAGVKYKRGDGWSPISETNFYADLDGPHVTNIEINAYAEAFLGGRFSLLVYSVAGPFVEFGPYVRGDITYYVLDEVAVWTVRTGLRLNVGITFAGFLKDLLGLGDYSTTLGDWTIKTWEGHWGQAPSDISISVEPLIVGLGGGVWVTGTITSGYVGSKHGTVTIEYGSDGVNYNTLASIRSTAAGDYTFWWTSSSAGDFFVRSSWTGNQGFKGDISDHVILTVSPIGPVDELGYDDAEVDQWMPAESVRRTGLAVRFTTSQLWALEKIKVYGYYAYYFPPVPSDVTFDVEVWDQERNELFRRSYSLGDCFTLDADWREINIGGILIQGDFYIVIGRQEYLIIGWDWDLPCMGRSYEVDIDTNDLTYQMELADLLIHAVGFSVVEDQAMRQVAPPVERTDTFYTTSGLRRVTLRIDSIWDWDEADHVESSLKSRIQNLDGVLSVFFSYSPTAHRAIASILYDPAKITAEEINAYANSIPTYPYRGYNYPSTITEDTVEPVTIVSWVKFDPRFAQFGRYPYMTWEWYDPDGNLVLRCYRRASLYSPYTESESISIKDNKLWHNGDPIMDIHERYLGRSFQVKIYLGWVDRLLVTQSFRIIKYPSSISIAISSDSITYGDSVEISSQTSPSFSDGTTTLQYSTDELNWINIASGTPSAGSYSYNWVPPHAETYYVRAVWSGTPNYAGNTSETLTLTVNKAPTDLSTSLSSTTIFVGSTVTITATLTSTITGAPLQGKDVTIQFSTDDFTWYPLNTNTTDSAGQMPAYEWTPDLGVYYIRSMWYGDDDYLASNSPSIQLTVEPSIPTIVEIVSGADAEVDRNPEATVEFGVRVKDAVTGQYLTSIGRVEFYVRDQSYYNNILIGSDNDTDGDGIYHFQWTANDSWPVLGPQPWGAYFTGTAEYMPSSATSTLTIYYYDVALWIDPTLQEVSITETETLTINFKWNRTEQDTFDLSLTGLDPSWYTLSQTSITLSTIGQTEQITLTISPPYAPTILKNYEFTVTATSQADPSFSVTATATARVDFTPTLPPTPTGGLATAVQPKTIYTSAGTTIVINILIINNQNFDDTVTVDLTTSGIPTAYQANLAWFDWTTAKVFLPAGGSIYIPLEITVPADTPTNMYVFRAVATSTANLAIAARDAGIIRVQ